eukprot:scaffold386_cov174-Ochromonas_danica.AAC.42
MIVKTFCFSYFFPDCSRRYCAKQDQEGSLERSKMMRNRDERRSISLMREMSGAQPERDLHRNSPVCSRGGKNIEVSRCRGCQQGRHHDIMTIGRSQSNHDLFIRLGIVPDNRERCSRPS